MVCGVTCFLFLFLIAACGRCNVASFANLFVEMGAGAGETIGYGCTFEASRKTLIATVPVGYHDGYMRGLSNRGNVIVRGELAPVIGRVSMDLTLIDVTNVHDVQLNDQVTLLGENKATADVSISAEDLARIVGTLSYEVTCGVGQRVPGCMCEAGASAEPSHFSYII